MKKLAFYILLCITAFSANAADFSTPAQSAILIDIESGVQIYAKAADELVPPSSMLKLMTLAVAFDEIAAGRLNMDDKLIVSENADYKNPVWHDASKICLVNGQKISVRDAILGLIVLSGGDAGVVLAEKIAGSESAMTQKMTEKARKIGMPKSSFGNVSGLPNPNNLMTSRELATLAIHLIEDYPDMYPLFATKRFEFGDYQSEWCAQWGKTHTLNYNRLLFIMPGADGLKTGHTSGGGYGMVASASTNGRRLVAVLNGLKVKGHEALANEMKKLLSHGFNTTTTRTFYKPGDKIVDIPVWYGRKDTVSATVQKPFAITITRGGNQKIRVLARFEEPLPAPVRINDKIGEIIAEVDGKIVARAPLIASEKVGKVQFIARIIKNLQVMFNGR